MIQEVLGDLFKPHNVKPKNVFESHRLSRKQQERKITSLRSSFKQF
jgi:hypothetical protein